jgi:hypothetical protein
MFYPKNLHRPRMGKGGLPRKGASQHPRRGAATGWAESGGQRSIWWATEPPPMQVPQERCADEIGYGGGAGRWAAAATPVGARGTLEPETFVAWPRVPR